MATLLQAILLGVLIASVLVAGCVTGSGPTPSPEKTAITVTSPVGGDKWAIGTTHTIQWSAPNVNLENNFEIRLMQNGQPLSYDLAYSNGSSYSWTVLSDGKHDLLPGEYQIVISLPMGGTAESPFQQLSGTSQVFSIVPGSHATAPVTIDSFNPNSGPAGTRVIINGSGFIPSGNTVNFYGCGDGVIPGVPCETSFPATFIDTTHVSFTVPSSLPPGPYSVGVSNSNINGNSNTPTFVIWLSSTVATETPTCNDSDGGINYDVKGTLNYTDQYGRRFVYTDSCYVGGELFEYYCENLSSVKTVTYTCPNGCSNGACNK
jgi:hypothetical protein